ncbi:MAG: DUF3467 domain-containing protein [Prevotella sp.]|jgi:hypothetical protein|nr:DUF3467 domain-containing protein [Prevotella sp.]
MEDNNNNQQQGGLQLELRPEVALGEFANLALITHSSSDFVLDFARMLPGLPKPQVRSRVVLAPEHAKRLLMALQENIYKYEQKFGKIQIPQEQPRTIAPFGKGSGEA